MEIGPYGKVPQQPAAPQATGAAEPFAHVLAGPSGGYHDLTNDSKWIAGGEQMLPRGENPRPAA